MGWMGMAVELRGRLAQCDGDGEGPEPAAIVNTRAVGPMERMHQCTKRVHRRGIRRSQLRTPPAVSVFSKSALRAPRKLPAYERRRHMCLQ